LFLFPGLRRRDVEFRYEIDRPRCIERVELRVFEGAVLARSHRSLLEEKNELSQSAKLKEGEYLGVVTLECRDGSKVEVSRQPIVIDDEGVIPFKIFGGECRCSER
jgi:hypothetical protein